MTSGSPRGQRTTIDTIRRTGLGLLSAAVGIVATAAVAPAASASPPLLKIESPHGGAVVNSSTPGFTGTTEDESDAIDEEVFDPVTLEISNAEGPVQNVTASTQLYSADWSAVAGPLLDGTYTARAIQSNALMPMVEVGRSEQIAFSIDTTPPQLTITTPTSGSSSIGGSQLVGGSAGTASGDLSSITIQLWAGGTAGPEAPAETLVAQASQGSWSATFGGLAPGSYTARASQSDQAGNTGTSTPVTFNVSATPGPPLPAASFKWFPQAPETGERVSLVSSSTDSASPLTGFAWALSSNGAFSAGKPVLTTSFATPGGHVVRLRVTDAGGRSSIATQTIPVAERPLAPMQPFPIVRIAGSLTSSGARIALLTVQAPLAARISITCSGPGCRTKSESRLATISSKSKSKSKSRAGTVLLSFRRFERSLRAGAVLKILVSKPEEMGKYTSFKIRRFKFPVRFDACLDSAGAKPTPCPTS
jgi:hypothetical protein